MSSSDSSLKAPLTHQIVIAVYNAAEDVDICLQSVLDHLEPHESVIVVDDASGPEAKAVLAKHAASSDRLTLITNEERRGYTRTCNRGLAAATADIVTLLNSDTIVSAGWGNKILEKFARWDYLAIVGPLSNAASWQSVPNIHGTKNQTAINALPEGVTVADMNRWCEAYSQDYPIPFVPLCHGFCLCMRRSVVLEMNGFDEENFPMGYGEEDDFVCRVIDAGYAVATATDTFIFHAKSKSFPSEERIPLMKAGQEALRRKHGKDRIMTSVLQMQHHPSLIAMREHVRVIFEQIETQGISPQDIALPVKRRNVAVLTTESTWTSTAEIRFEALPQYEALLKQRWDWSHILVQEIPFTLDQARRLRRLCSQYGSKLIFDLSSKLLEKFSATSENSPEGSYLAAVEELLQHADWVITPTQAHAESIRAVNPNVSVLDLSPSDPSSDKAAIESALLSLIQSLN